MALLERLVRDKLEAIGEEVRAEGWKWVQVAPDLPYGHTYGLRRVFSTQEPLSEEDQARYDALRAEYDQLEREYEGADELPDEVDARLGELEAVLAGFEKRPALYDPVEIARAGAFVSLDYSGAVRIERGFVRPEDEPPVAVEAAGQDGQPGPAAVGESAAVTATGASAAQADGANREEDEGEGGKPVSDRLMTELTAHRTLALRGALAGDPASAFLAVLHVLALRTFYGSYTVDSCLEIEAKSAALASSAPGLNDMAAGQALAERHGIWSAQMPRQPGSLWDFLLDLDGDSRMSLFAYCAARTVNAVYQPWDRRPGAIAHADKLAAAVGLDMSAQWTPTVDSYLGRVTKARILEAVREAKGEAAAQLIDHLKKGDMAAEAERLLAGTGWLPQPLRTPGVAPSLLAGTLASGTEADTGAGSGESVSLPAFLVEEPAATEAEEAPFASAAE